MFRPVVGHLDFYDLMTFHTNILLLTTVTAVNMNILLVLTTVIFFRQTHCLV